ncbi:MAG: hypothetical protein COZ46_04795 [Verrucomicrobia bacterium CG_4_10_14_3_um_filter_43_23]|nr:MAG: hypothetical protein AUJ82_08330 [Verrucomicrobia bacterium CG1_02_43_26]PIP59922.1 MAG: hypothetical protein COX01_00830 [Verrucomicrobia bacterium CG22_combo_CG10-13_8_21_14_all_43_17]PIX58262.1 MAG: hypothetical protein COZ46_04795 [Verrucomicrobia bacterium CG_4_10_14_3_um_filter_43_23]PIY62448.1 MAG: hypothetical protein COY94_02105 [Verrucomicrobia bacterium CG_4_10_14_0_8_um_filter_43_34]PJA44454.1 MAG: hypothetical protein CO175_02730 [Verrucomicrobia bacterium CG_4_9_14_3_um_fi
MFSALTKIIFCCNFTQEEPDNNCDWSDNSESTLKQRLIQQGEKADVRKPEIARNAYDGLSVREWIVCLVKRKIRETKKCDDEAVEILAEEVVIRFHSDYIRDFIHGDISIESVIERVVNDERDKSRWAP